MESFLPSEIGRLIYGYLQKHCGSTLAEEFTKSCQSMQECREMKLKYARNFHTTVQDLSLEAILDQYSKLCSLIFKYTNENEHIHKNVLNLLEKLLNERQNTSIVKDHVFKDVQNLPSNRNAPEIMVNNNEATGLENKLVTIGKKSRNSSVSFHNTKKSCDKKKSLVSSACARLPRDEIFSVSGNVNSVSNSDVVVHENIVKKPVLTHVLEHNSVAPDKHCKQQTINLNSCRMPVSSNSCSPVPQEKSHKSIFDPVGNISLKSSSCFPDSSNFHNRNVAIEDEISYSPLETGMTDVIEDVEISMDESSALVDTPPAANPLFAEKNRSESKFPDYREVILKANCDSGTPAKCPFKSPITKSDGLSSSNIFNLTSSCSILSSDRNPSSSISLDIRSDVTTSKENKNSTNQFLSERLEEGEILSSESDNENTKKLKLDPVEFDKKEEKRKLVQSPEASEKLATEKNSDDAKPVNVSVPSKAEIPFLSEECRSIFESLSKSFKYRPPYTSPAKSTEFVHRAALSPFSKMFVTPTKPNFRHSIEFNLPAVPNQGACSNISSHYNNAPLAMTSSLDSKNLQLKNKSRPPSVNEKHSAEKTDLKKLSTQTQTKSKKLVKSHNISLKKKIKHKSIVSNELIGRTNDETKIKSLDKKNIRVRPSSKSGACLLIDGKKVNRVQVFVQETNEIAVLDISPEFVLFHRNSISTFCEDSISPNYSR